MGNISFVFKDSSYSPPVPPPPTTGWVDEPSFATLYGEGTITTYFTKMFSFNDHLWASGADGTVWLYGPSTDFEWSNQGGSYDLPDASGATLFQNSGGALYASQSTTYKLYKYAGGWNEEYDWGDKFALDMAFYQGQRYISVRYGQVWKEDSESGWIFDFNIGSLGGSSAYDLVTYSQDNVLYLATGPSSYVLKKDLGGWSISFSGPQRRARTLFEASDGYLYCGITLSDVGQYNRVYQWNGSSWDVVAGIGNYTTGQAPVMEEYNGYIYLTGSGFSDNDIFRFPLNPTRGQENATLSLNLASGTTDTYALVSYKGYLFACGRENGIPKVLMYSE